jgi:hypothetical protein
MKKQSTHPSQGPTSSHDELTAGKRDGRPGITVLADDDVRRGLEQRALRNARGLVNSLEREAAQERELQSIATRVIVAIFIIGAALLTFLLLGPSKEHSPPQIQSFPNVKVPQNK